MGRSTNRGSAPSTPYGAYRYRGGDLFDLQGFNEILRLHCEPAANQQKWKEGNEALVVLAFSRHFLNNKQGFLEKRVLGVL